MNIAYHWNMKARPILCMPIGITFTASAMSLTVAPIPFDCDRMCASSSSVGSISFVRDIASVIVTIALTAPNQKTTNTQ